MTREAIAQDFHSVMRLYRQLHVDDPVLEESADRNVFDEALSSSTLHLMVLEREQRMRGFIDKMNGGHLREGQIPELRSTAAGPRRGLAS
jgi:hypothetical protein